MDFEAWRALGGAGSLGIPRREVAAWQNETNVLSTHSVINMVRKCLRQHRVPLILGTGFSLRVAKETGCAFRLLLSLLAAYIAPDVRADSHSDQITTPCPREQSDIAILPIKHPACLPSEPLQVCLDGCYLDSGETAA